MTPFIFISKDLPGRALAPFLSKGVTLELEGDANDYLGKGISGGRIIVYPSKESSFIPEENILVGNTLIYGGICGEIYMRGIAGERFCVRNSGANAVIEGVGDHGCEYMTGGRVVVLGITGRNFAAGMSGGIAYVWDKDKQFANRCNLGMVDLMPLVDEEDKKECRTLMENHAKFTGSTVAKKLLDDWKAATHQFIKVYPRDYRRVVEEAVRIKAGKKIEMEGVKK